MKLLKLSIPFAAILFAAGYYFFVAGEHYHRRSYPRIMNTLFTLELAGSFFRGSDPADAAATDLKRLDEKLSNFIPESEVCRINRNAGNHPVDVSAETFGIVDAAVRISMKTAGAFDVTIGPLVTVWRITPSSERVQDWRPPAQAELDRALRLIGCEKVVLDRKRSSVLLPEEGMSLDLGGIAKGYALDWVAARMAGSGVNNFLAELGGNIYARGLNSKGRPWRIGILRPGEPAQILGWAEVSDASVSTSGDYESFRTFQGVRFNHILDPHTGEPARELVSVTVVAPSGTEADALSTAVFVAGREKGTRLIEEWPGAGAVIVDSEMKITATSRLNGKFHQKQSNQPGR